MENSQETHKLIEKGLEVVITPIKKVIEDHLTQKSISIEEISTAEQCFRQQCVILLLSEESFRMSIKIFFSTDDSELFSKGNGIVSRRKDIVDNYKELTNQIGGLSRSYFQRWNLDVVFGVPVAVRGFFQLFELQDQKVQRSWNIAFENGSIGLSIEVDTFYEKSEFIDAWKELRADNFRPVHQGIQFI